MTFSKLGKDIDTGKFVYLPRAARTQALYVIGMQRMGKSGLYEELILQDIKQGIGVCVLDPHRELIDHVIARLPPNREKDVISLDITDMLSFFGLPLLDSANLQDGLSIETTRNQFLHVFEKAFGITTANPVMYTLLSNVAYTLIYNPGYTIIDIRLLLTNRVFREALLQNKTLVEQKPNVIEFWHTHYDQLSPQKQEEESFYILDKLNDFENAPFRYIVGQSRSTLDLQKIMDEGKILLVKLHRQLKEATKLIGSILVALILNASDTRTTTKLFNLYADEFQNFATPDFVVLLEQGGKRNVGVSMAHQNRSQLEVSEKQADEQLKDRTLSVGNLVVFRVPIDAKYLAGQFDHSPRPGGETRLENMTEQVFNEWDEDVWDSEELKAEYLAIPEKIEAVKHTMLSLAKAAGIRIEKVVDGSGSDKVTYDYIDIEKFQEALSLTPEAYAKNREEQHPVFYLLPYPDHLDKQLVRFLLEHIYSYPGNMGRGYEDIKSTQGLLEKLDVYIPGSDYPRTYGYQLAGNGYIFTYPLRNKRAEQFTLPSTIPSIIEERLQKHWWERRYETKARSLATLEDQERSERLARELSFDKRAALSAALLQELQEVLTPAKEQAIYTYNPAFRVETFTRTEPDHIEVTSGFFGGEIRKAVGKIRWIERKRVDLGLPIEKRLSKWGEAWDVNFEVFMPVLEWIHQRILSFREEIVNFAKRRMHLWHHNRRTVHHKVYLHERPLYDEIGDGSKYRDYDRAVPQQRRVPTEVPSSEVLNRVGNELGHLEKFTAWVKIGEPFSDNPGKKCLSCRLLNMYGAKLCSECGTKLPDPNEYVITTIKPEEGLYGEALEKRLARIQAQNIQSKYLREREKVEAEITQRQSGFSGGSSPAQQKQLPRRVARTVPVQENCSNCGASNQPGSNFCNQCGEKLEY